MPRSALRSCFEAAVADLLTAIKHKPGTDPNPLQAAAYVAATCRTGEIGFQTLLGAFLRLRLEQEGTQYRLAINCTAGKGRKQPDFQVISEEGPNTPVLVAECKLMDAGCQYNSAPNNVLRGLREDLASLTEYKEIDDDHRFGCLFFITDGSSGKNEFTKEIMNNLNKLKPNWIGKPSSLWLPKGMNTEPTRVKVAICSPAPLHIEPPISG